MKFLFFIRKFLISFEFVCILIGIMAYMLFSEELDINLSRMQINPDTVKFVVTIPMIIFGWIWKSGQSFFQRGSPRAKILVNWPGYFHLKQNFIVGMVYSVFSLVICLLSILNREISALNVISFICGLSVISVVALNFYFADSTIKDMLEEVNEV